MDPTEDVCKSLVKWLQTLVAQGTRSLVEISDGVAILQILIQIAPEHFRSIEPKLKTDVGSNWRLKISNLKKILESIIEYYQDVLNLQVLDNGKPDVNKIGESSNLIQLGKLLRLVLGCAVNCERKGEYITQIMALEESVQQCIMQAIQELDIVTGNTARTCSSLFSLENDTRIFRLMSDLETANETKETLAQQCHNLETQVQCLLEEKQVLLAENQSLVSQARERETMETTRSPDNRRQIDLLKEELFKLETARDDYRAKTVEQEKQIVLLQEKLSDLQLTADTASRLKDEVDALSESANKVQVLENTVASYKKKLEDYGNIKKQLKLLEDKNVEYYQQNLKYEEELKSSSLWKNQSEMYKKQASELHQKLDEETQRADKCSFQSKNLESKLLALQGEKERLALERDALREENEELKLRKRTQQDDGAADVARELTPNEMKQRLQFLEKEYQTLLTAEQDSAAKQVQLDDALSRIEKLTDSNRNMSQKVVELEMLVQEQKPQRDETATHHLETAVKEYKQKTATLQDELANKDNQLQIIQAKYSRSIEKAKEVARNLDAKSNGSIEFSRRGNMKETEERLLTGAFYQLSLACHCAAVDERLGMLSASQGQSFLSRQRQPTPRKPIQPFKSK